MAENKITFGSWEAICMLIVIVSTKCIMHFPRIMADAAGTAGWILIILETLFAYLLFAVVLRLFKKFKGSDIIDVGQEAAGKAGRIAAGVILTIFFGAYTVINLRENAEQMKILTLDDTPISLVIAIFMAGMIIGAIIGLESVIRFMSIMVPVIIVSYLLYLIMLIPNYDPSNLLPLLGNGYKKIISGILPHLSIYGEMVIILLIFPFIKKYKYLKSSTYWALGFNAFFMLSVTVVYTMVIPYPINLESYMPVYQMGRMINYSRFFQRIESLFVTTWSFMGLMYTCILFYFTLYCFMKAFKLKDIKPLIPSFSLIIFTLCFFSSNALENYSIRANYFAKYSSLVTFAFPAVFLIWASIKKRAVKKNS